MSQDKVILATTEVIDGVMLTRECLVYAAATINSDRNDKGLSKLNEQTIDRQPSNKTSR